MWYSKNKWSTAKKSEYQGYRYDSKFEASCAQDLEMRLKAGEITSWERQVKIPLTMNGYHIANYYIDFVATRRDGVKEYIEAKGRPSEVWRLKWKLFEALYGDLPDVELIVLWQKSKYNLRKIKKL